MVTTSVEEGILLPCNPLMQYLLQSALATAQTRYPVRIVAILISGTHIHLLLVVEDPNDVNQFMAHFKTEYAHMVNNLLGREKRTVWCEGYHSAPILDVATALEKLAYVYTNPAKDALEHSIEQYPGFSTWSVRKSGPTERKYKRIRRPALQKLPEHGLTLAEYRILRDELRGDSTETVTLKIEPDAWMDVYKIRRKKERRQFQEALDQEVKRQEEDYARKRVLNNKGVIGAERLRSEGFNLSYIPKRMSYKAWCFCSGDAELRKRFIAMVKQLIERGKEVVERWKLGDYSVRYPIGLYPPSMPKLAEPIRGYWSEI